MSKYADIEQIKEVIRTEWVKYMPMELDVSLSFVLGKISEVPTIEVSVEQLSKLKSRENSAENTTVSEDFTSISRAFHEQGEWTPCTKEGLALTELMRREGKKWYGYRCTNCNFIYKGNALTESRYCQWCGAKMKGADDE